MRSHAAADVFGFSFARFRILVIAVLAAAGCANNAQPGMGGIRPDLAASPCDGAVCNGGCDTDKDCKMGERCQVGAHTCVQCLTDGDCASGQICNPVSHQCAGGCSSTHGCPDDGGLCDHDAGMCVECVADGDCRDAARPRCDPVQRRCAECLPQMDNCGYANYCAAQANTWTCAPGCKDDGDCSAPAPNPDGGAGDGGGSDGGAGNGSGLNRCDQRLHQCVRCIGDNDCPLGKLCKADTCVDGCNAVHGCPMPLSCCNQSCADESTDFQNCGACGVVCTGGWNCCNSACSNPAADIGNCGGCGVVCAVAHGTPKCASRTCAVASCNPGWADCNGNYMDGCEIHTDLNPTDCGGCGNACQIPHAAPKCVGGACQIDTCIFPFLDCNNMVQDGCEINVQSSDLNNCGACNLVCKLPHATPQCSQGVCRISRCDNGFADCNNDPSDGCETDLNGTVASCGACNQACVTPHATPLCNAGQCQIGSCNTGWAECNRDPKDGCEINVAADPAHCGACATACSTVNDVPTCVNSTCQISCNNGFGDCDKNAATGCEINLNTDVGNCGTCATACSLAHATPQCTQGLCKVASCDMGYADCDLDPKNGCEINIAGDADHCGSCVKACSRANGLPSCVASACQIACNRGFDNCDGDITNGCETNLNTSLNNCGACGTICSLAHAIAQCTLGACAIATCESGYFDCNGDPKDGCEAHIAVDINNCGTCRKVCSSVNGTPSCVNFACQISCNFGYGNCDNDVTNGCESNFATDVKNCGGCGTVCNPQHATPTCSLGQCRIGTCDAGYSDCNMDPKDGCEINTAADPNHCGLCATVCSSRNGTAGCSGGACSIACNSGFADCNNNVTDGCEASLNTDSANCGTCANACSLPNASSVCTGGACAVASCNMGFADCDNAPRNGCEVNLTNDVNHCGICTRACSTVNGTPSCQSSACQITCNTGYGNCDNDVTNGCETNLNTNVNHCSACGSACVLAHAVAQCTMGACAIASCNTGFVDCDLMPANGCEINTAADIKNCGSCGNVCSSNNGVPSCNASVCQIACAAGFGNCDGLIGNGCEANLKTDANNCGGCGTVCMLPNATPQCTNGACAIASCSSGYADCNGIALDGCEVNLNTDPNNCGSCGGSCSSFNMATRTCTAGQCTGMCGQGFADCNNDKRTDGCEVNLNTDVNHCGSCPGACSLPNATPACAGGACAIASCNMGFADCNAMPADGCEINTTNDATHCGTCARVCSTVNGTASCVGSACQIMCNMGYGNCDNDVTNGCETNLNTSVGNCGACGAACALAHAVSQCTAGACAIASCNTGFADCNAMPIDGCEINTAGDIKNCGNCGNVCSSNNGTPSCNASVCQIACAAGFGNCDGLIGNGCEANLKTDPSNCGVCGTVCMLPNATSQCTNGACAVTMCNSGYADCNGVAVDGCEINLNTDPNNCGSCGGSCSGFNMATRTCTGGQCTGTCGQGFADCNNNLRSDGCETNISSNAQACGGCGRMCSSANIAVPTCGNGVCNGTCNPGFADCNADKYTDGCETNVLTSNTSCGGCNMACAAGTTCLSGICCGANLVNCAGRCVNLQSDNANCGMCGGTCAGGSSCLSGICCVTGQVNCANRCVNTSTDSANCGGCGTVCGMGTSCQGGICCPTNQINCGNACVNPSTDNANCGGCAMACMPGTSCLGGICCAPGQTNCSNRCVNLQTDNSNCGACGSTCGGGSSCLGGICCSTGLSNCGNRCVNLKYDNANCGACGTACAPGTNCLGGVCCGSGLVNCGTGCTSLQTDNNNCGTCGNPCGPGKACQNGICCATGLVNCGGVCVDLSSNLGNCGACGTVCPSANATPSCVSGVCQLACNPGFADCNGILADGCEINKSIDVLNCGTCGTVCSTMNISRACSAGSCQAGVCNAGFADCNNNKQLDGCEINTNTDINNCGTCGTVCSTQNIAVSCGGGVCNGTCTPGFLDCNGNKQTDGCEVNSTNDVNHCGSCANACPTVANGTRGCVASACAITSCNTDYYDADGQYGNGCECLAPNVGPTCAGADAVGAIAWGSTTTRSGILPPGSAGAHWYSVSFAQGAAGNPPQYHPQVIVSGANFVIDVFLACAGTTFTCGDGGVSSTRTAWEVFQTAGDQGTMSNTFSWATPPPGTTVYVKVRPVANTGCASYTVTFQNL